MRSVKVEKLLLSLGLTMIGILSLVGQALAWGWEDTFTMAQEVWPEAPATYVANIAECESHNDENAKGGGWWRLPSGRMLWQDFYGLLQIDPVVNAVHVARIGDWDLTNPRVNLMVARLIQKEQGWRAWPVCSR